MDERTPLLGTSPSPRQTPSFLGREYPERSHVGLDARCVKRLWTLLVISRAHPALILLLLSVAEAYIISRIGTVSGKFYSAFVDGDKAGFSTLALTSIVLYLLSSLLYSFKTWLSEFFAWRWRSRLTLHIHRLYGQASFMYGSLIPVDHPDQRIAQDLPQFCTTAAKVLTSVAAAPFGVVWYTWCVVGIFGSWLPVAACWLFFLLGACLQRMAINSIARLVYKQEQLEGSYRFAHMRVREYQQEIALCSAQRAELQHLQQQLEAVLANQGSLVLRRTALAAVTKFLDYSGCLVNYSCIALAVFAGHWAGAADSPGGIAAKVSISSFYLLTLVYSFTQVLDLGSALGDLAGLTGRVAVLLEALQQQQEERKEEGAAGSFTSAARQHSSAVATSAGMSDSCASISDGLSLARSPVREQQRQQPAAAKQQQSPARSGKPPLSPGRALLRPKHYYQQQRCLTMCSSASSLLDVEQQQQQQQGEEEDAAGEELGEYRRQGSSGMDRYASQAVMLQPPTTMRTLSGCPIQVSLHSLGADLLLRDVAQVFPGAPRNATLLAAVTFQPWATQQLATTTTTTTTSSSSSSSSPEPSALDTCLATFLQWEAAVRSLLQAQGHWCDCVDPLTGYALHGPRGRRYNEVVGAEVLLGYCSREEQGLPLAVHPQWGTQVYPATLMTSAPLPLLKAAVQAALQPAEPARSAALMSPQADVECLLSIQGLACYTPSGQLVVRDLSLDVVRGASLLISGPSGCGKSTLLRCLLGLWPMEAGRVVAPGEGQTMCLPQRPVPAPGGQLAEQLVYPDTAAVGDAYVKQLLQWVQLQQLAGRGQCGGGGGSSSIGQQLSPGELQRAGFARLLHHRPQLALIDEGTSSVAADVERHLFGLLRQAGITWVSVGHGQSLRGLHSHVLQLAGDGSGAWELTRCKLL